jgi:hypothetical protein
MSADASALARGAPRPVVSSPTRDRNHPGDHPQRDPDLRNPQGCRIGSSSPNQPLTRRIRTVSGPRWSWRDVAFTWDNRLPRSPHVVGRLAVLAPLLAPCTSNTASSGYKTVAPPLVAWARLPLWHGGHRVYVHLGARGENTGDPRGRLTIPSARVHRRAG